MSIIATADNNTGDARSDSIKVFASGAGSRTISVSQEAAGSSPKYMFVRPTFIDMPPASVDVTLTMYSNTSWTAGVPSDISWCHVNPTSGFGAGEVTVNLEENTGKERVTDITFTGDGVERFIIPVTQRKQGTLSIDPHTHGSPQSGDSFDMTITANENWHISIQYPDAVGTGTGWVDVDANSGYTNVTVHVTVRINTHAVKRHAIVQVKTVSDLSEDLQITQAGTTS